MPEPSNVLAPLTGRLANSMARWHAEGSHVTHEVREMTTALPSPVRGYFDGTYASAASPAVRAWELGRLLFASGKVIASLFDRNPAGVCGGLNALAAKGFPPYWTEVAAEPLANRAARRDAEFRPLRVVAPEYVALLATAAPPEPPPARRMAVELTLAPCAPNVAA